jgi:hypothetical protein
MPESNADDRRRWRCIAYRETTVSFLKQGKDALPIHFQGRCPRQSIHDLDRNRHLIGQKLGFQEGQ